MLTEGLFSLARHIILKLWMRRQRHSADQTPTGQRGSQMDFRRVIEEGHYPRLQLVPYIFRITFASWKIVQHGYQTEKCYHLTQQSGMAGSFILVIIIFLPYKEGESITESKAIQAALLQTGTLAGHDRSLGQQERYSQMREGLRKNCLSHSRQSKSAEPALF